ncbi:hypothetical protein GCM10010425_06800 [Streptomyces spororaveus]|uniref:Uncharacterized protein n=1 Tax=Streptomyces spororaveus TaxID=284039 RepID=A0ABQ3TG95_9ACTN|nr:hypothetical protein Sspor_45510 [Streptomyces spororaveus]
MLPTQRTALVEISRWSMTWMPWGTAAPESVDHGLQVLLVDHQVVGLRLGHVGDAGGGVRRGVVQGDRQTLARQLLGAGGGAQGGQLGVLGLGAAVVTLGEGVHPAAYGRGALFQGRVVLAALLDEVRQLQE